jgi:hypothetical protein
VGWRVVRWWETSRAMERCRQRRMSSLDRWRCVREDAGIPARVIDELMSHQRSRHSELDGGSRIGARYRHTTDAMAVRVVEAIQERLTIALRVAQDTPADRQGPRRVF